MTDLLDLLLFTFAGCRFLASRRYRQRTLARWSEQPQMKTIPEILATGVSVLFVLLLPLLLWGSLRSPTPRSP